MGQPFLTPHPHQLPHTWHGYYVPWPTRGHCQSHILCSRGKKISQIRPTSQVTLWVGNKAQESKPGGVPETYRSTGGLS